MIDDGVLLAFEAGLILNMNKNWIERIKRNAWAGEINGQTALSNVTV